MPVLIHDGTIVPESTVICEYAEEVFPDRPIYPAAPSLRAQVRIWTKAVDEELHPGCSAITYVVSHRHTILRNGVANFDEFVQQGATQGSAARALKWQWIHHGLAAPGAADKIKLYDGYLRKMDQALGESHWLVGDQFSMADIAMTPYVNRLAALAMEGLWRGGRYPHVERWFGEIQDRSTFTPAFVDWMPEDLRAEMHANGERSWEDIRAIVGL